MENERIESLEQDLKAEGEREIEYWDIKVVYHQSSFGDEGRCSRPLPATYDLDTPYREPFWHSEKKRWVAIRILEPLEDTANPGSGGILDHGPNLTENPADASEETTD